MAGDAGEMNSQNNNREILSEFPRLTENDGNAIFRIISIPGKRKYPRKYREAGVEYNIKDNDKRILIEIETATNCPHCNKAAFLRNNFVFTTPDLEQLWEELFKAWILPSKKYNYAKQFKKLIERKLLQAKLL